MYCYFCTEFINVYKWMIFTTFYYLLNVIQNVYVYNWKLYTI